MDQRKIGYGFECLMISLCLGDRAVPLLWKVVETKGEIGVIFYGWQIVFTAMPV